MYDFRLQLVGETIYIRFFDSRFDAGTYRRLCTINRFQNYPNIHWIEVIESNIRQYRMESENV